MKKLLSLLMLGSLSVSCYAETNAIYTNSPNCEISTENKFKGCFKNKTGAKLTHFSLMVSSRMNNGSENKAVYDLSANNPNFYAGFTMSKSYLKQHNIASIVFSIVKTDAGSSESIPGCLILIDDNHPSPNEKLSLKKPEENQYYCV